MKSPRALLRKSVQSYFSILLPHKLIWQTGDFKKKLDLYTCDETPKNCTNSHQALALRSGSRLGRSIANLRVRFAGRQEVGLGVLCSLGRGAARHCWGIP